MITEYLNENSPEAFVDFPPIRFIHKHNGDGTTVTGTEPPKGQVVCAQCKGHGGWNLRLNAYPVDAKREKQIRRHLKTTPFVNLPGHDMSGEELRHHYVHFRASCNNCNGWGYVPEAQGGHIHTWDDGKKLRMCLTLYTCTGCGEKWEVDSSD